MPVSTRSQTNSVERSKPGSDQEPSHANLPLRNPHHGLKEKMRALTLLYEQQKQAAAALRNPNPKSDPEQLRFSSHPSVELLGSCKKEEREEPKQGSHHVMRENNSNAMHNSTVTRTYVLPQPPPTHAKENVAAAGLNDRILSFTSCPRKSKASTPVARRLSMGGHVQHVPGPPRESSGVAEGARNVQESETPSVSETPTSRILVFVRLRPMAKKEKEAGSVE